MPDLGTIQAALAQIRRRLGWMQTRTINLSIDGGGSAITTGPKGGFIQVPFSGRIKGWCLIGDRSGSLVVDVWKAPYASAPPDSGHSITGSAKPTLASQQKAESYSLAGWTLEVEAGDVFGFNVVSASTVQSATLTITVGPA